MTSVRIERDGDGTYTAHNGRGAVLRMAGDNFSPVELLLAAIGGCTAIDVDVVTSRRAEPDSFEVVVDAEKIRDESGGNRLKDVTVTFRIAFPEGVHGDEARAILPGHRPQVARPVVHGQPHRRTRYASHQRDRAVESPP